ncbi:hypothetical protein KOR42_18490 [Thalassoglobus neptunius]|uniref:Uncharacterized protein n=1 Tax=Thalassoglobus neptunius TaxID=1938619 RepID=A0A5C5X6C9_9PLAN|nr:hypothetical protein [Thalassoglobus neptunius]TWT58474.1 hypothetical protein KOR42_18490 [Thalassoglobus neptunius]
MIQIPKSMHQKCQNVTSSDRPLPGLTGRSGATLVEVLMALLIFSVAITSVFTLFPISLLTALRATQATNSKFMAENVVEAVRSQPGLLHPPIPGTQVYRGVWQPNFNYAVGDFVSPVPDSGALFPKPNFVYRCTIGTPSMPPGNERSGFTEPDWPQSTGPTVNDGNYTWTRVDYPVGGFSATGAHYVVDPLGRYNNSINPTDFRWFGFNSNAVVNGTAMNPGLPRTKGGFETFGTAIQAFSQPDSWTVLVETVPVSIDLTGANPTVTFPDAVELDGIPIPTSAPFPATPPSPNYRMVLVGANGERTAVSGLLGRINQTVTLSETSLPTFISAAAIPSTVRIENFTPRYTYLMTVRQLGANVPPIVTVVMLFNRSFNPDDEQVYKANFGNSSYSDDTEVTGAIGFDQVKISWAGLQKPLLREGNYIFDARNVLWYKMADISVNEAGEFAIITLTESVQALTVDTGTPANSVGRAILMPGIVDIFEL